MNADEFYNSIRGLSFYATCADIRTRENEEIISSSVKANYRKVVALIKRFLPDIYEDLALNLYNLWNSQTYRSPKMITLTHSATEYFFKVSM